MGRTENRAHLAHAWAPTMTECKILSQILFLRWWCTLEFKFRVSLKRLKFVGVSTEGIKVFCSQTAATRTSVKLSY